MNSEPGNHKNTSRESARPESESLKSGTRERRRFPRAILERCSAAWHGFWHKRAPSCRRQECPNSRTIWHRLRRKNRGVWIEGSWYCLDECLEHILTDTLRYARALSPRLPSSHRVPLGLLLFSSQQLTVDQLHAALRAQRESGYGRIGEWLERLGFVTQHEVTVALARQWSCPILKTSPSRKPSSRPLPHLPAVLLESSNMIPVEYVETTRTLHVAFSERVDYSALYAVEQMLECRTEPCLATPSLLAVHLDRLSADQRKREVVFHGISDAAELARIIASYSAAMAPCEIRRAACGSYVWIRLLGVHPRIRSQNHLDLLFGVRRDPAAAIFGPAKTAVRTSF
jgi:hypothetical protein